MDILLEEMKKDVVKEMVNFAKFISDNCYDWREARDKDINLSEGFYYYLPYSGKERIISSEELVQLYIETKNTEK